MHSRTQTEFYSPFILTFLSAAPSPPLPTPSTLFSSLSHFHLCLFFSFRSQNRQICVLKVVKMTKCKASLNEVSETLNCEPCFFFFSFFTSGREDVIFWAPKSCINSLQLVYLFLYHYIMNLNIKNVITLVSFTPDS